MAKPGSWKKSSGNCRDSDSPYAKTEDGGGLYRPKSYKSMRKAGADYFYDQQKKLKRIYDLVNDNQTNTVQ